jgi:hypothetical protein
MVILGQVKWNSTGNEKGHKDERQEARKGMV